MKKKKFVWDVLKVMKKMKNARKPALELDFSGPLWGDAPLDSAGLAAMEQLVLMQYDDHDGSPDSWFLPLLAEGLTMEEALELVLHGATHPN